MDFNIPIFHKPNLTPEVQADLLSMCDVGNAEFIESGVTVKYNRLRNIGLADLQNYFGAINVLEFLPQAEDEALTDYKARISTALNSLKLNTYACILVSESGFGNLSNQPEFINS